jgi:hypothetical protein
MPAAQMAHLALPDTQADPSAKPKEPLFTYAPETVEINISKFVELLLKIYFRKSLVIRKLYLLL